MDMTIEIQDLLELIVVVTTIKLITSRYRPPIQESIQAIICIGIGTILALIINPTPDGFVTGIFGSGLAFYGGDLVQAFKSTKKDLSNIKSDE